MAQTGYSKIQIYSSSTATDTPSAGNLTNDTNGSELAINITDGKLFYKDNSGTVQTLATKATALSTVTNNGVVYVNSSGQATSGSALVFDGTNFGIGTSSPAYKLTVSGGDIALDNARAINFKNSSGGYGNVLSVNSSNQINFGDLVTSASAMVLSTGNLGLGGTSSSSGITIGKQYGGINLTGGGGTYSQWGGGYGMFPLANVGLGIASSYAMAFLVNNTSTQAMTLDASGNLIVGNTLASNVGTTGGFVAVPSSGASYSLTGHTSGTASGTAYSYFFYNGNSIGSITQSGTTAVLYNTTSDYRLKSNVVPVTTGLSVINQLNPVNFTWISDNESDTGFLAHEFQTVIPRAVTGTKDATIEEEYEVTPAVKDEQGNITTPAVMGTRTVPVYQQMDNSGAVPYLVAAIKELSAQVTTLQTQINGASA